MRLQSILTGRLSSPRGFSSGLIAASCILVVVQAIVIATLGHRTFGPLFSDVTQLALGLICILACTEAFRRSQGIARYAWRLLAAAFVVWTIAQGLAVYAEVSGDHSPDSLSDILFFLSVIPFGMLTFLDPDGEPNSFDRLHILDFVQVCILAVSILLCFSPKMWSPGDALRVGHFTWSRNIFFDGLLVVTFVLRAALTKSQGVRWLFGRMALFLLLSGLADSYALCPGQDLPPGGWFDLMWSALLGFPIVIAATWKNATEGQRDGSPKAQNIVVNQIFPLVYPLITFLVLPRSTRAYPVLSTILFALSFITFAVRVLIIQHRQGQSNKQLKLQSATLEAAANAMVIADSRGSIMWVNGAFTKMTGYCKEEVLGKNPRLLKSGNQPESYYADLWSTISSGQVWHGEIVNKRKDGALYTEEMTITPVTMEAGDPAKRYFIAVKQDITERKRAEESLLFKTALLEAQTETTIDGILVVDESNHIILANKQLGLHFGIPDELLRTRDDKIVLAHVVSTVESPDAFAERIRYLYSHRDEKSRDEFRLKDGKAFDRYSAPLVDSQDQYRGRIWYFRDITDRKLAEERVQFLAYYDALTGLPNRALLQDRLSQALAAARRQKDKVAVLFLDIDRFKDINDSLGHSVGDLLLQKIAERLQGWGREQDTVARLSGDEFVITLTHAKDAPDAAVATERLMDALSGEFVVEGHAVSIGCSVGIRLFPEHGTDCETLIKNADAAMYSAKADGRNNFRFFNENMNAQVVERLTLESSLRLALSKDELFLMYQPQMEISTGRITGLEALLRWQHPTLGLLPPNQFIRIAENSGLILPIGEWVLRTACSQVRKWQEDGLAAVTVAVNISAIQFRQPGFCGLVRKVLRETGLPPQCLELELTESLLLANAELMLVVVHELKDMGVTLAIDDFGTGYSSFSYLKQFRVNKLKIDRSFIQDVAVNPDDAAITTAIISMAKSLHLNVIAEGVENEAQMSFLRAHHCEEIQGYYCSKPLTAEKAADKLRGDDPKPQARAQASGAQS